MTGRVAELGRATKRHAIFGDNCWFQLALRNQKFAHRTILLRHCPDYRL